ncbi:hypothetical protein AB0H83_24305 [Dactylosporangium sp. NPDC050688]|uniref:hypothetical protein n=1 Tax=Dactylosporangium sp. NPDC050688 TaxID=3157217 RepID=UPI0034110F3E
MRTKTFTTLTAALTAGLLLTACTPAPEHRSGDAAPAGPAAPSTSPTTPAPASPTAQASSPAATKTSATATKPVLGPVGYGAIRLGMTKEQALATGVVTAFEAGPGCATAEVRGAPKDGWVMLSPRLGVTAINAWDALETKEGVRIGMSSAEMRRRYPTWTGVDGDASDGRGYAKVPGNDKAIYRIVVHNNKVTEVTLQLVNQDCYE